MVESDLVPLDELPYEEEPERDVLGPGAEHSVSRDAQCSCAVAVEGPDSLYFSDLSGALLLFARALIGRTDRG